MAYLSYGDKIRPIIKSIIGKMKKHKLKLNDNFLDDYVDNYQWQWVNVFGEQRKWTHYKDHVPGYIYMIRNIKTGMIYIGQTENVFERKSNHLSNLINFCHISTDMQLDSILYGIDCFIFEIIEFEVKSDKLLDREKYWIKYFNTEFPNGYNVPYGERKEYNQRASKKIVDELLDLKKESKKKISKDKLKDFAEKVTSSYRWLHG